MMKLARIDHLLTGVFGKLFNDDGSIDLHTLEHSYPCADGLSFLAKIPTGVYTCIRGVHQLKGMSHPFETFEIIVPGHTDLLFHVGNTNEDTSGCVLLGVQRFLSQEILQSRIAFNLFMEVMRYVDSFELTVS
jgi:hypothetical protein